MENTTPLNNATQDTDDLIVRHLTGDTSSEDEKRLGRWRAASPRNERYFQQQQELWFSATTPQELARYDADEAYRRFCRRTQADCAHGSGTPLRPRMRRAGLWRPVAAAVLLCMLVCTAFFIGRGHDRNEGRVCRISVPAGSTATTLLPDGTAVTLSGGSTLSYASAYGRKLRSVRLEGEGFFKVKKNAAVPFRVETRRLTVNDIGTEFCVTSYAGEPTEQVVLVEGSVSVGTPSQQGRPSLLTTAAAGCSASLTTVT